MQKLFVIGVNASKIGLSNIWLLATPDVVAVPMHMETVTCQTCDLSNVSSSSLDSSSSSSSREVICWDCADCDIADSGTDDFCSVLSAKFSAEGDRRREYLLNWQIFFNTLISELAPRRYFKYSRYFDI